MTVDTSLSVTGLDFETIRANLRNYMAARPEFADYDFEDSALGTLLDLLAYNTYYMGYYANMAANEGFLDTAQLYESVASHAKVLGYLPYSNQGPTANVKISYTLPVANSTLRAITINKNTKFKSTVNGVVYSFVTPKAYTVSANSTNGFTSYLDLVEGTLLVHRYLYTTANTSFVVPNISADTRSFDVTVTTSGNTQTYLQASDLLTSNSSSKIYFIEPDRGGKYKISFGDGYVGKQPAYNSTVSLTYRVSNGSRSNGARTFTAIGSVGGYSTFTLSTIDAATGGASRESIESIRSNAPRAYEAQNRAVTINDYSSIILKNNTDLKAVSTWGGEDNDPPIYGKIYISVIPSEGTLISTDRKNRIKENIRKYNVQSIGVVIVDPTYLYIVPDVSVRYDPLATTLNAQDIASAVATSIVAYEQTNLNRFGDKFRFSQFLRSVDLSDTSITTSSAVIRGQKRFVASTVSANRYVINFNTSIHHPHDGHVYAVSSSSFTYNELTAYFDDDGYGNLRVYSLIGNERSYINSSIGTVDYSLGTITIDSFLPTATENANSEINITVSLNDPNVSGIRNQIILLSGATISVFNDNTGQRENLQSSVATVGESTTLLQTSSSSSASY